MSLCDVLRCLGQSEIPEYRIVYPLLRFLSDGAPKLVKAGVTGMMVIGLRILERSCWLSRVVICTYRTVYLTKDFIS
jgi:hypothetical protein